MKTREKGYMMTCVRCGVKEFIHYKKVEESGWKDINFKDSDIDEPIDVCPMCAELFDKMYETFIKSFDKGTICYADSGNPVIFDLTVLKLKVEADAEEARKAEIEEAGKKALEDVTTKKITYTINPRALTYLGDTPLFLQKKFVIPNEWEDASLKKIEKEKDDE